MFSQKKLNRSSYCNQLLYITQCELRNKAWTIRGMRWDGGEGGDLRESKGFKLLGKFYAVRRKVEGTVTDMHVFRNHIPPGLRFLPTFKQSWAIHLLFSLTKANWTLLKWKHELQHCQNDIFDITLIIAVHYIYSNPFIHPPGIYLTSTSRSWSTY